jgi:GNAT superfamily N-acetyltransferase
MSTAIRPHVTIRDDVRPGDLGRVIELHGGLYAGEYGFDHTFEAYVAETIGQFGRTFQAGLDRLWLAELDGRLVGSIAIARRDSGQAQLRWFLLHPEARGLGLGRRLVEDALAFSRAAGYRSIFLWTVDPLITAARLYASVGFRRTETRPRTQLWGSILADERYDLTL